MAKTFKANSPAFWLATAFLVTVYLFGGGARSDILSLVLLRPIAAVALVIGLARLTREDLARWRSLFGILAASAVLATVQLVPLPGALWQALPGHRLAADIDAAAGLAGAWRPISIAPAGTLNALFALFVPAAFLAFLVNLDRTRLDRVVMVALALGLFSALIGVAQSAGAAGGPLYFYRITNSEFAVGLFSNRNHQAVALTCLYPMLAMVASRADGNAGAARVRRALAVLAGIALVPLILVTGSRLGVGLAVLAMVLSLWVYRAPAAPAQARRESKKSTVVPILVGVVIVALAGLTALLTQVSVFSRFTDGEDATSDLRFQVWGPIVRMVGEYFPFGSGLGSFDQAYRIGEPDALLSPKYLNHAHNDFLEVALTGGLVGVLILLAAALVIGRRILAVVRGAKADPAAPTARTGAAIVVLVTLASVVDYPLRTPSIACIFILATVCLWQERTDDR